VPDASGLPPSSTPGPGWLALQQSDLAGLVALAEACDGGSRLATDIGWLTDRYYGPNTVAAATKSPLGGLVAVTAVENPGPASTTARPTSPVAAVLMVHPESRRSALAHSAVIWVRAQARVASVAGARLWLVSESLNGEMIESRSLAGLELVFEKSVLQRGLDDLGSPNWPAGTQVVEWHDDTAHSFYEAYRASFSARPGFPGWSKDEWARWLTADDDFRPEWSLCALHGGVPVGFIACGTGFIIQAGVVPGMRRQGLARALLLEAMGRMRSAGATSVMLTVNTNNQPAQAAWKALAFAPAGRRGRMESRSLE
jgi:ribosomal protein S18 acetylase RimI-like enzyme